jgi:hypothetical protein
MVLAHSLFGGNVAEHVTLLLVASSHAPWTCSAFLGYTLLEFFSSLLGAARARNCSGPSFPSSSQHPIGHDR